MKKALITGAFGQDGYYLTQLLLEKNYQVHATGRSIKPDFMELGDKNLIIENIDVLNKNNISRLICSNKYDEIYHLAAKSSVGDSFKIPSVTISVNALGILEILESCRLYSPMTRIFNASSSEMFGDVPEEVKKNEHSISRPVSPYAVSKASAHLITSLYRRNYNMFCCSGIMFNHESPKRDFRFVTRKISSTVARILAGQPDILRLGDLTIERDWGHAKDYALGMWLMLQRNDPDDFVLATGIPHSLEQLVNMAFDYAGLTVKKYIEIDDGLKRKHDIQALYGDPTKAHSELNWRHSISIEETIAEMIEYDLGLLKKGRK